MQFFGFIFLIWSVSYTTHWMKVELNPKPWTGGMPIYKKKTNKTRVGEGPA